MSNTVFILGAGASVRAGVPTMKDFWTRARRNWKTGQLERYDRDFEQVERAQVSLINTHSRADLDYTNLESFVTAIEMAGLLNKLPGFKSHEIEELKDSIRRVIVATIEEELQFTFDSKAKNYIRPPEGYNDFAVLLSQLNKNARPSHKTSVITFNYDIGLDFSLYYQGLGPEYCLEDEINEDLIKLLKLHGSTNWVERKSETVSNGEEIITHIPFEKYFDKYRPGKPIQGESWRFKLLHEIGNIMGGGFKSIPFVAPPSWNKIEYQLNLKKVWARAAEELASAENLIIIGFSMPETDLFFKNLFALGMVGDTNLQNVWVFNPDEDLEGKYLSFLGPTAKHKFNFNPEPISEKETPKSYNNKGTFKYAIYSIATRFDLEDQFQDSFWSLV